MPPLILTRMVDKFLFRSPIQEKPLPASDLLRKTLKDPKIIAVIALLSITIFIFSAPSSTTNSMTSSKRPDKTTTGFFNPSVDCFANSTIQSLSSLPSLNNYFNAIANIDLPPNITLPAMPLHSILMQVITRLQSPVYKSTSVSVWDTLHVLEKIHKAKMNRVQHDAQELMQLIIETLEAEYMKLKRLADPEDIPVFPFQSKIESRLRCMRCQMTSTSSQTPMNIISLNVPQKSSTTLDAMLKSNQSEIIEGYSCFICALTYIYHTVDKPQNASPYKLKLSDEERLFLSEKVFPSFLSKQLTINDDLADSPFYESIKSNNTFLTEIGKSIVHREISFVDVPKILPIHLSRSIFSDTQALRNSCSVEFPETLQLASSQSIVTYKLKSVIRHHGSHDSGHYECYKSKPMFFKRKYDGGYYNDYPPMKKLITSSGLSSSSPAETTSSDATPSIIDTQEPLGGVESSALNTSLSSNDEGDEIEIAEQLSLSFSGSPPQSPTRFDGDIIGRSRSISNAFDDIPKRGSIRSRTSSTSSRGIESLRRRVSTIIGNKQPTVQASFPQSPVMNEDNPIVLNPKSKKSGDKKLASVIKKPFWRISDGKVSECSLDSVLGDGKAAYMLIYEIVS